MGRYTGVFGLGVLVGVGMFLLWTPHSAARAQTLTPEQRAALQKQYDELQAEIAQYQKVIDDTRTKEASLQGDVTQLNAQINKAQSEINQRTITINQLSSEITQKTQSINTLQTQLDQGHESLAKLLREKNEIETTPLMVVALSSGSLSDFLSDVDDIDSVNQNLQALFDQLRGVKTQTEAQKEQLAAQQSAQLDARHDVVVLKQAVSTAKQQKTDELTVTKGQESAYNKVLADKQAQATQIRNALFDLRDTSGITFESALNYATLAQQKTGVRAALTLAILSQESDLGKNIGSCEVTDLTTGDGTNISSGDFYQKVMKAPRDTDPFQSIASASGRDWRTTPVSCPLGKVYTASRGYGGALGPSQFIPSTWDIFAPRIKSSLGLPRDPDPWNPQDAIMATALYLKDLGAAAGTYSAERNAACKYYSGRSCDTRSPINYTYGNSVIAKADTFQKNIDFLNNL